MAVASKCVWLYCSLTYRPGIRPPSQALVVAPQKLKTVAGFRVELLDASDQNTEFNSDIQTIRLNVSEQFRRLDREYQSWLRGCWR